MPKLPPHVQTDRRGWLRYRRRWPVDLAGKMPTTVFLHVFGTKDVEEMLDKYDDVNATFRAQVKAARRKLEKEPARGLTDVEIRAMAADFFRQAQPMYARKPGRYIAPEDQAELVRATQESIRSLQEMKARGDYSAVARTARTRLAAYNFAVPEEALGSSEDAALAAAEIDWEATFPGYYRLCEALMVATIELRRFALAEFSGTQWQPAAPDLLASSPNQEAGAQRALLEDVAKEYLSVENKSVGWAQDVEAATKAFKEVHGNLPIAAIDDRHAADLKMMLQRKPRTVKQGEKDLPLPVLVEKYDAQDVPRISAKTVNKYLLALSSVWSWGHKHGRLPKGIRKDDNPFAGKLLQVQREENPGYSVAELRAIFNLPVFTQGERPAGGKGEAAKWLPLLALFTGARREELAQLSAKDVRQDAETGIWLIDINTQGQHRGKARQNLKNEYSRRCIPIHPELIACGFLEYAQTQGEAELFSLLKATGRRGTLAAKWGDWWSGYLKAHGLKGDRAAFHTFRHTWTTFARRSGIPLEARIEIQGRSREALGSDGLYGDKRVLALELRKFTIEGLDLSHLHSPSAQRPKAAA